MKTNLFKTFLLGVCLLLGSRSYAQSISVSDYVDMYDNTTWSTSEYASPSFFTNYVTAAPSSTVMTPFGWYNGGAYVTISTDGDILDFCDANKSVGAVLPELSDESIRWNLTDIDGNGQATLHVAFTGSGQTALFRVRTTEYNSGIWTYNYHYLHFTSQ